MLGSTNAISSGGGGISSDIENKINVIYDKVMKYDDDIVWLSGINAGGAKTVTVTLSAEKLFIIVSSNSTNWLSGLTYTVSNQNMIVETFGVRNSSLVTFFRVSGEIGDTITFTNDNAGFEVNWYSIL